MWASCLSETLQCSSIFWLFITYSVKSSFCLKKKKKKIEGPCQTIWPYHHVQYLFPAVKYPYPPAIDIIHFMNGKQFVYSVFLLSFLHSKLSIVTHHSSQAAATRLEYDHNGKLLSKNACARDVGTTVSLQHLFSTLPVRHREFLRNIKREFSKLVHVLQGYCLVSTGVRITCSNQVEKGKKTTIVSTNGSKQVKDNITCVFGPKQVGETCCSSVNLSAGIPIELQNKASVPMTMYPFQL